MARSHSKILRTPLLSFFESPSCTFAAPYVRRSFPHEWRGRILAPTDIGAYNLRNGQTLCSPYECSHHDPAQAFLPRRRHESAPDQSGSDNAKGAEGSKKAGVAGTILTTNRDPLSKRCRQLSMSDRNGDSKYRELARPEREHITESLTERGTVFYLLFNWPMLLFL